jgi:hypothetical protein
VAPAKAAAPVAKPAAVAKAAPQRAGKVARKAAKGE